MWLVILIPHELLLTNTQVSRLRKTLANNQSANIKLLKNQENFEVGLSNHY